MAKSSITKNFVISGEEQVEKFANAIEESYQEMISAPKQTQDFKITHLHESEDVKRFMQKRKEESVDEESTAADRVLTATLIRHYVDLLRIKNSDDRDKEIDNQMMTVKMQLEVCGINTDKLVIKWVLANIDMIKKYSHSDCTFFIVGVFIHIDSEWIIYTTIWKRK